MFLHRAFKREPENLMPRKPVPPKNPGYEDMLRAEQMAAAVKGFIDGVKHVLTTTNKDRKMMSMTPAEAAYVVEEVICRYVQKRAEHAKREEERALLDDDIADIFA